MFKGSTTGRASSRNLWPPPSPIGILEVRFLSAGGLTVASASARDLFLLPESARLFHTPRPSEDPRLSARLGALGVAFEGNAAIWVQDIRTGRIGSWNADA